jgi:hypothetical protein
LDCLRHNVDTSGVTETEQRREARLASNWDSDCAFEADNEEGMPNWWEDLKEAYGLDKLVDVNGNGVEVPHVDFDDQADMCEIIRTLIVARKFDNYKVDINNLSYEFLDEIDCFGDDT